MPGAEYSATPPTVAAPSAAARERAVELLTRHYAEDQLTDAELQVRLDRVYQVTTQAELDALVADLPDPEPGRAEKRVVALFSGQEQRLTGPLPRCIELHARFGYVELDLTRAEVQPGITDIDVHSFAGYVEIRLPAGVRVESTGHALFGYFALKGGSDDGASVNAPLIRVHGRAIFGYAECFRGAGRPPLPGSTQAQLQSGEG